MPCDLTSTTRTAPVTAGQLTAAGLGVPADHTYRLRATLEPEADGTPAVGLYLDVRDGRRWDVCEVGTLDDAATTTARLDRLWHEIDPYHPAWLAYHGATDQPHGWVWLYSAARAKELGLSGYEIAKRSGVDQETVRRYLTGRQGLGVAKWEPIARVLGIHLTTSD